MINKSVADFRLNNYKQRPGLDGQWELKSQRSLRSLVNLSACVQKLKKRDKLLVHVYVSS